MLNSFVVVTPRLCASRHNSYLGFYDARHVQDQGLEHDDFCTPGYPIRAQRHFIFGYPCVYHCVNFHQTKDAKEKQFRMCFLDVLYLGLCNSKLFQPTELAQNIYLSSGTNI